MSNMQTGPDDGRAVSLADEAAVRETADEAIEVVGRLHAAWQAQQPPP